MARQPHPEINFRRGKALRRSTAKDILAMLDALGMSDEEKREFLRKCQKENESHRDTE